jgi:hypothetical protein
VSCVVPVCVCVCVCVCMCWKGGSVSGTGCVQLCIDAQATWQLRLTCTVGVQRCMHASDLLA